MSKDKVKMIILLHVLLMVYSLSGVCSKMASKYSFLSLKFCFFYGLLILLLGIYAVVWQQIIKRLPLTTAFANKAVTVVWGIIWGMLFFHEKVSFGQIVGACLVIVGVVVFATADENQNQGGAYEP